LLKEGALEQHNLQLQEKYKVIKGKEVLFEAINTDNADIIFVAYGIAYRIIKEAALRLQDKVKIGIFRPISLWPFPRQQLQTEAQGAKDVFVFELSCGQMVEDVNLALGHNNKVYFYGRTGGGVFSVDEIVDYVESKI
jgi:2-oxoglutarate ferredoxin oxidoreductase subunit alpha